MKAPGMLFAKFTAADGRACSLALLATHWASEGTCVYERLTADGKAAEAVEKGTWRVAQPDAGPSVLSIEWPSNGDEVDLAICDLLMLDLCQQGAADTYEPLGDQSN
jgi:hypothetical protein